ncbi:hypothetical protein NDU88_005698 [Pleurodeles waltl]|uniref:Uncharacterized protein n=1 Tax=Pleurodeles waltl TaxID=8319 RepID=A0AAV7L3A1_PLEWA|nr:hypothetical protein NDU88_005698 [Pleurodeles waltl]
MKAAPRQYATAPQECPGLSILAPDAPAALCRGHTRPCNLTHQTPRKPTTAVTKPRERRHLRKPHSVLGTLGRVLEVEPCTCRYSLSEHQFRTQ